MIISANGIVFNHYGDVLLIRRDDTRTFAPPGGACEIGELPDQAAAREVEEETGLRVHPVRLVGLYFLPTSPEAYLHLCFRCIQRGGELTNSVEATEIGFFRHNPLPTPMLSIHREQVERAFVHSGGSPDLRDYELTLPIRLGYSLLNRVVYPWLHRQREQRGEPAYAPPPDWSVRAMLLLRNEAGDVLWRLDPEQDQWTLPISVATSNAAPWAIAAEQLRELGGDGPRLQDLEGVFPKEESPEMCFLFSSSSGGPWSGAAKRHHAFFAPGTEPPNSLASHRSILNERTARGEGITFMVLS